MRIKLLLPAIMLFSFSAQAGEGVQSSVTVGAGPTMGDIFPHFGPGQASKQQVNLRLVQKAYASFKNGAFVPIDSSTYKYTGKRGSTPDMEKPDNDNHILFDESVTYTYNAITSSYDNNLFRTQTFDKNDRVQILTYQNWSPASSVWKNYQRYLYAYDNNGKMQSSVLQQWYGTIWTNSINSVLNYDGNNNIIQLSSPTYTVDFGYDQNNNLVSIVDKVWQSGVGWNNNERKTYSYTGKHVTEYILEKWNNSAGNWSRSKKIEYQYDAAMDVQVSTEYTWNGSTWIPATQHMYTHDNKHNVLQDVARVWNGQANMFINKARQEWTYNVSSLPVMVLNFTWNGSAWIHAENDERIRFYYEQYDPTSVPVFANTADIQVYPVPASDVVNIAVSLEKSTPINVMLNDVSGRMVYNNQGQASGAFRHQIPVNALPAGTYILSVYAGENRITRRITVSH